MATPTSQLRAASRASAGARPTVAQRTAAPQRLPVQRKQLRCRAAAGPEAAEEASAAAQQGSLSTDRLVKPNLLTEAWNEVIQMRHDQVIVEAEVKAANKSGLVMPIGKLKGFLPYKLLDASRLEQRRPDGSLAPVPQSGYRQLIGTKLRVKVTQVIVPENRLIVSEKAVLLDELAAVVRPGDLVDGRVGSTTDWGAFVECLKVNGQPCPRAEAVLPMREISYSWLNNADEVLQSGQLVRVAVVQVSQAPEAKVLVSLKRLEEDPLKETLDNVLPLDREGASYEQLSAVPAGVPPGVDEILEALDAQPGIGSITLGRCVEEKRTVSQDLELWITKETVAGGYNLAVRAGRVVQEVIVATSMGPEEMRATVQRVLRSIN